MIGSRGGHQRPSANFQLLAGNKLRLRVVFGPPLTHAENETLKARENINTENIANGTHGWYTLAAG